MRDFSTKIISTWIIIFTSTGICDGIIFLTRDDCGRCCRADVTAAMELRKACCGLIIVKSQSQSVQNSDETHCEKNKRYKFITCWMNTLLGKTGWLFFTRKLKQELIPPDNFLQGSSLLKKKFLLLMKKVSIFLWFCLVFFYSKKKIALRKTCFQHKFGKKEFFKSLLASKILFSLFYFFKTLWFS